MHSELENGLPIPGTLVNVGKYIRTSMVPARLGKGQGAKEIGHNLTRERPKFGHNLVRKRHKIGHSLEHERQKFGHNPARERKAVWAQFCGRLMKTYKSASILQAFLHRLSENTKTAITFCKNKNNFFFFFFFKFGQGACKSGRVLDSMGRAQRPQI